MEERYKTFLEAICFYIDNDKYPTLETVRGFAKLALNQMDGDQEAEDDDVD